MIIPPAVARFSDEQRPAPGHGDSAWVDEPFDDDAVRIWTGYRRRNKRRERNEQRRDHGERDATSGHSEPFPATQHQSGVRFKLCA